MIVIATDLSTAVIFRQPGTEHDALAGIAPDVEFIVPREVLLVAVG